MELKVSPVSIRWGQVKGSAGDLVPVRDQVRTGGD